MKKRKVITFTVKANYNTKIDNIHAHLQEVNRGTGIKKPRKGKGSYTRKVKHKKRGFEHY